MAENEGGQAEAGATAGSIEPASGDPAGTAATLPGGAGTTTASSTGKGDVAAEASPQHPPEASGTRNSSSSKEGAGEKPENPKSSSPEGSKRSSLSVPGAEAQKGGSKASSKSRKAHEEEAAAQAKTMLKSSSCPGPGDYMWRDDVHLRKKPVWSVSSPDRKCLDLLLCTWTPASMSLQPRAPDPGEYSIEGLGRHGKVTHPVMRWKAPHEAPKRPEPLGLDYELPPTCGGKHPVNLSPAVWTMHGAERKYLPADMCTWTPKPPTEWRPGPGAYDVHRRPQWKVSSRRGTFGGRQINLHPDERAWVPKTRGAQSSTGEAARLRPPIPPRTTRAAFVPEMLMTRRA